MTSYAGHCPFTKEEVLSSRTNLRRAIIPIVSESWAPFSILSPDDEDQVIGGVYPDLVKNLAQTLNFTIKYIVFMLSMVMPTTNLKLMFRYVLAKERGVWGIKQSNGSWTGIARQILEGDAVTTVAGFFMTSDRTVDFDFTFMAIKNEAGVFVRRPQADDISVKAYTSEFRTGVWLILAIHTTVVTMFLFLVLTAHRFINSRMDLKITACLQTSLNISLRYCIETGSGIDSSVSVIAFNIIVHW